MSDSPRYTVQRGSSGRYWLVVDTKSGMPIESVGSKRYAGEVADALNSGMRGELHISGSGSGPIFPNIARLIAAGSAYIDDHGLLIGRASDGQEVTLGIVGSDAEQYLVRNPTPDKW